MKKISAVFLLSVLLLAACAPAAVPPTQNIDVVVQQTFAALTAQAPGATPTPIPPTPAPVGTSTWTTGSIAGTIDFPADAAPAARVVAFDKTTNQPYSMDLPLGQNSYQIDNLPPGSYVVVAYSLGGVGFQLGMAGGYTGAMLGHAADHTLSPVTVQAGQITQNINTGDWVTVAGSSFPPMPGVLPPTPDSAGPQPLKPEGGIAGTLTFPAEGVPSMLVVAFSKLYFPNGNYYYALTKPGQNSYEMILPQGEYYIVAYALDDSGKPTGVAGGYTACGASGPDCVDHSLIAVPVAAGGALSDINPSDWFTPASNFPPYPLH